MKRLFLFVIFLITTVSINHNIFAQEDEHIVVVTTWYVDNPEDGSASEFDSLATLIFDKVVSKNSKIINRSLVRHMYGSDSRQRVVISEYASMEDLDLAGEEGGKLFQEAFPNEEDRKSFSKAYGKYWNGHHADEIYSMVVKK